MVLDLVALENRDMNTSDRHKSRRINLKTSSKISASQPKAPSAGASLIAALLESFAAPRRPYLPWSILLY
jgi:hypothetical protein